MMTTIPQFKHLAEDEIQLLLDAPALVTLLIGSADGKLDEKEIEAGLKMVVLRKESSESILLPYYEAVNQVYDKRLFDYSNQYKEISTEEKIQGLSDAIAGLNEILSNVDPVFSSTLVKSLRSFAKEIAQASGGWANVGYFSVSKEEADLIDLPMLEIQ